jgi:hypothetical protein
MANEKNPPHWTTPRSPFFLSSFEIIYGHPFLLGNLPPTDPAPLADYLPYLNLLRELLREHEDQILPHASEGPITISIKSGDLGGPHLIWSSSQHPQLSSSKGSPSGSTSQG